jgi:hypothetical protein
MEHLYKSIDIKNYLICYFPLPDLAIELIIDNLKLAIDLNGYTNIMLKTYIMFNNINLNEYIRLKYGKNRSNLSLLKKYQLIHIIQHYNIDIPLQPYKIDELKKFKEDNNITLSTENNSIIINNITLSVNTLIPININSSIIKNLFIYIKTINNNKISNYALVCKYNNNNISIIINITTKIDYVKLALLYCYTTVYNNNLTFTRKRTTDNLYIEMRNILCLIHDKCCILKLNNTDNIFTKTDIDYILYNIK